MLPYLKHKDDGVGVGPVAVIKREPDDGSDGLDMLGAVADDILMAIKKDDKALLREALEALCAHVQEQDEIQDKEGE